MGNPLVAEPHDQGSPERRRLNGIRYGVGLVALFLTAAGTTLGALAVAGNALPGWSSTIVSSGSMRPTIDPGDIVIHRRVDPAELPDGSVIVFSADGRSIVHRVVERAEDRSLVTRGDANAHNDTTRVPLEDVSGQGLVLVPWIGLPRVWLDAGRQDLVAFALAAVAAIALASRWAWPREEDIDLDGASGAMSPGSWLALEVPRSSPIVAHEVRDRVRSWSSVWP